MTFHTVFSLLPLAFPCLHLAAAFCSSRSYRPQLTLWLSSAGLGTAMVSALAALTLTESVQTVSFLSPAPASYLLTILVAFLGLIIGSFSRNYLAADPGQARFARMLHLTLAAVATVAITDNLFVLLTAWMAVSLALNELLLFYPNRSRAVLAAHKKFLFARLAEISLVVAFVLLYQQHGTAQISAILSAYPTELGFSEQLAITLIALAAVIKCAQMPVHGWLIQVVEAPTPVSALLHAGVVNLGGYLLILFAPLLSASAFASGLVLVVAGLSVALAGLIMTTRVTVKVKLAWSTVAQMGLMLVECGLGLYELALLHLLAHACYKAYLFLRSGSAVQNHIEQQLAPPATANAKTWLLSMAIAASCCVVANQLLTPGGPLSPWLLLAAFLTVLLVEYASINSRRLASIAMAFSGVLLLAYLAQKKLMSSLVAPESLQSATLLADVWIICLIAAMVSVRSLLHHRPDAEITRTLRIWLYAGLYLDEWVTRKTLQIWPLQVAIPLRARPKRTTVWEGE